MVTQAQNSANLRTAQKNVAAALGIEGDGRGLTYDVRTAYNKALAAEILRYPQSFTAQTLETAERIQGTNYDPLADASFSWGEFTDAAAEEARITLPAVGKNLLVGVVIVACVYFGLKAWRSAPAAAAVPGP